MKFSNEMLQLIMKLITTILGAMAEAMAGRIGGNKPESGDDE